MLKAIVVAMIGAGLCCTGNSEFSVAPIDIHTRDRIVGVSYKANNGNISLDDLRLLKIKHYDFGGNVKDGELIVNKTVAKEVLWIFKKLYEEEYPINSVRLVDDFGGDDYRSMTANNTSAFNYRTVEGTSVLSGHGYGYAVDINPLFNPVVKNGKVSPAGAEDYTDRTKDFAGKINKEDLAYKLFKEAGWQWGGHYKSLKDYQHFEKVLK